MAWSRFTWVEKVTQAVAARFNNEEEGIEENKTVAATALSKAEEKATKSESIPESRLTVSSEGKLIPSGGSEGQVITKGPSKPEWKVNTASLSGSPFLFGVNGAYNDYSYWVENNVLGDRGGLINAIWNNTTEAFVGNEGETITVFKNEVGERIAKGLIPIIQMNVESLYLGKVNATNFGKAAAKLIEETISAHPAATVWEIINEPYFMGPKGSNASQYAEICKEVYKYVEEKVTAKTISAMPTLLVFTWGRYTKKTSESVEGEESSPEEGGGWIVDFFATWSEGKKKINGYSFHGYAHQPYLTVPQVVAKGQTAGIESVASIHATLVAQGASYYNNIYMTECGYERSELSGGTEAIKEAEQSEKTLQILEKVWEYYAEGWLKACLIYNNNSANWGIYGKPAGTTWASFAAARKTSISHLALAAGWPPASLLNGPYYPSGLVLGTQYTASNTRPVEVVAKVKLEAAKTSYAEGRIQNPVSGEGELGGIDLIKQESKNLGYIVGTLRVTVPPGWKYMIKAENAVLEGSIYYWVL